MKPTYWLEYVLMLSPVWVSVYLAFQVFDSSTGLMLGLTFIFWGGLAFIGWLAFIVGKYREKKLGLGMMYSLGILVLNITALTVVAGRVEDNKAEHFEKHHRKMEAIAQRISAGTLNINEARRLLTKEHINFGLIGCNGADDKRVLFTTGALDILSGYYYQSSSLDSLNCRGLKWKEVAPNWLYGYNPKQK